MSGQALLADLELRLPELRGRLRADQSLAEITWFRVGGSADILFTPADEADLAYFLSNIPKDVPVQVIGLGSNLLVRDGGLPGVVVRLARGFTEVSIEEGQLIRVGTAVPDVMLARAAGEAGLAGLEFYRGIPGAVGGALRMNAGAHGSETKDVLVAARAVDRDGTIHELALDDMGYRYRHSGVDPTWIFTEALYRGVPGDKSQIQAEMDEVAAYREANQPTRERTGGSTFKNPPGKSAWRLIDEAGCRGLQIGGAKVSDMHCNFLINTGTATAEDIERLGETVRQRVNATSGILLEWEIKRIGVPAPGRPIGEELADLDAT